MAKVCFSLPKIKKGFPLVANYNIFEKNDEKKCVKYINKYIKIDRFLSFQTGMLLELKYRERKVIV